MKSPQTTAGQYNIGKGTALADIRAARSKVSPVADGEAYCPLLDFVADQIETLDRIEEASKCTHDALMDAVHERHGYDTWAADALEAHIIAVTALRDSVQALANSVRALRAAEREAFDALSANTCDEARAKPVASGALFEEPTRKSTNKNNPHNSAETPLTKPA